MSDSTSWIMVVLLIVGAVSSVTSFIMFRIIHHDKVSRIPPPNISHVSGRVFRIWLEPSVTDQFGIAQIKSPLSRKIIRCQQMQMKKLNGEVVSYEPKTEPTHNLEIRHPVSESWFFDLFYPEASSIPLQVMVVALSSKRVFKCFTVQI